MLSFPKLSVFLTCSAAISSLLFREVPGRSFGGYKASAAAADAAAGGCWSLWWDVFTAVGATVEAAGIGATAGVAFKLLVLVLLLESRDRWSRMVAR